MRKPSPYSTLVFAAILAFAAAPVPAPGGDTPPGAADGAAAEPVLWAPTQQVPSSPGLVERGRALYAKQCSACHGAEGRGDGPAAYLLYPKPRDFRAARYRLVSTWERVPTDEDLYQTISRGMPGSAMPSWGHLPEADRWALVHYVKTFAAKPITVMPTEVPDATGSGGAGVIAVPPEPPYGAPERARAAQLFAEACATCHGARGKGDGEGSADRTDEEGYPTRPRDFTSGVFKANPDPEQLYRRIIAGLPGTPMPEGSWAYGDDGWHLVHLIREMSSDRQRQRAEMRRFRIAARRVARIPEHPDDGNWRQAPSVDLHLMPLWWRPTRPEELTVRALHDGRDIAMLLVWADETHDDTAIRTQDFRDAAAVQLALDADPPFFAMGEPGSPVNTWMWKAERDSDTRGVFRDLEAVYPNIGIDSYPNLLFAPFEQPQRHALTLQSDRSFVTGWGAGNIVSDPHLRGDAEDLSAEGFGTLQARSSQDPWVRAPGVYGTGSYRVMFRRALKGSGPNAARLKPGRTVPIAFAVWNGSAGDRDGKKSVTIWQELVLER
jgi:mono/diheme cytochrome c family protein